MLNKEINFYVRKKNTIFFKATQTRIEFINFFSVIDGTGNYSAYTFYNWGAIDIFCYFSHHFITIPPLGWINVGHAHGTQVIGK